MNYHLFVVDEISLKYHLEYMFVGTGKSNPQFDIELWKDIVRLKVGDKIVFYVQNLKKFYGFFEVSSSPFFDNTHYLQPNLMPFLGDKQIKLQYRALIKPYKVFQNGIDEFQLIDILPLYSKDILWSILYRKLKGARGCSPLFGNEFNLIFQKIAAINNNHLLNSNNFTFYNGQIRPINQSFIYRGNRIVPNIKQNIFNGDYKESHLHALLIEFFNKRLNFQWIGNEVYSSAGMQAMDILTIDNNGIFNIFEIKKDEIPNGITFQIKKYIEWLKHRFWNFNLNYFQPVIIGKKIAGRIKFNNRIDEFIRFNNLGISLPIVYLEYEINLQNQTIDFYEIDYFNGNRILQWRI